MGGQFSTGMKITGRTMKDLAGGTLGVLPAGLDLIGGSTAGFSNVGNSWKDFGRLVEGIKDPSTVTNMLNAPSQDQKQAQDSVQSPEDRVKEQANRDMNQYQPFSLATTTNHVVASNYSGQMGGFARPSQLMAISDPNYKLMIASSRGQLREAARQMGAHLDLSMYPSLVDSVAGSGGSKVINSGGGIGTPVPQDAVSRQHILPDVNANERV